MANAFYKVIAALVCQDIHGPFDPSWGMDISQWKNSMEKLIGKTHRKNSQEKLMSMVLTISINLSFIKKTSIFCKEGFTRKDVERDIFANPFKRFEDMRFMKRCRKIENVEFNTQYVQHKGTRPMNIVWRLERPNPALFLKKTNKMIVG